MVVSFSVTIDIVIMQKQRERENNVSPTTYLQIIVHQLIQTLWQYVPNNEQDSLEIVFVEIVVQRC